MTQDEALSILKTGANVFLTGEPGSGKTYTINKYVSYLRTHGVDLAITASTGIAATHIGGMTIHSWSGIGIKDTLTKYDLDKIASSEYINKRVRKTRVLIIDEVSMLRAETLSMIDAVCREIRQNEEPFGGIQVVLVGDFFQLPPIAKRTFGKSPQMELIDTSSAGFAFESGAWERLSPIVCYLTEQHRQDDEEFLSVLSAIRSGEVEDLHMTHLRSRMNAKEKPSVNVPKLFSKNINVDQVNSEMLGKIKGPSKSYAMDSSGADVVISAIKRGCLSPERLELKIGAVVMCTKNNQKERFANGTLGTITSFEKLTGHPVLKTKGGDSIVVSPMEWSIEENGKVKAKVTQVPLRLAWAVTVHKSQGMSMDEAVMDLSDVFEYGQGYVALSRVRRLSGLHLLGINARALQVHPQILEVDNTFRKDSEKAREVFAKISTKESEVMRKNFILTSGGKWKVETKTSPSDKENTGRLKTIREKHKNAYKKWDSKEEDIVVEAYNGGKTISDISKLTGRQVGGIRARLVKLKLIEE